MDRCPVCARPHHRLNDSRKVLRVRVADLNTGDFLLGSRGTILTTLRGEGYVTVLRRNGQAQRVAWNPRTTMNVCRYNPYVGE